MMNIELSTIAGLKRKIRFKRLDWNEDAKHIRADLEITYHDQEGNLIPDFPPLSYQLNASGGSYRNVEGNKITLDVDEKGISIIPKDAISDFDYFKSINDLGNQIMSVIQTQLEILKNTI